MRTKIKVNGKYYRPVPWLEEGECDGCALDKPGSNCYNTEANGSPCDDGQEFSGHIFIRHTKEALAEYIAKKLGADDEVPVDE